MEHADGSPGDNNTRRLLPAGQQDCPVCHCGVDDVDRLGGAVGRTEAGRRGLVAALLFVLAASLVIVAVRSSWTVYEMYFDGPDAQFWLTCGYRGKLQITWSPGRAAQVRSLSRHRSRTR